VKILIADDDPAGLLMLGDVLREMGYDVVEAHDGREAYELTCSSDVRLVISDWQMPEMSGVQLCERIRQRPLSSYVYFILLTSLDRAEYLVEGLQAGADDFLSKPFNPDELRVRLRTAERLVSLESRDVTIFALAKLAESRDSETGAHLERMREYCRLLAEDLATTPRYRQIIDADYVRMIYLASPLHDIGKVGIPDNILLKPGKLTPDEFEIMKQHVAIGGETLEAAIQSHRSAAFLRFASDIVWSHHEKYNGRGYPRCLSGEDIPLCGRIVSLADVYDALTTKRVYKPEFTHQQARDIIVAGRGSDFDPGVVDAFLRKEHEFVAVHRRLCNAPSLSRLQQTIMNPTFARPIADTAVASIPGGA
jgi:putative two-component system response regulator